MAANAKRRKVATELADTVRAINDDLTEAERRITALEQGLADVMATLSAGTATPAKPAAPKK